MPRSEISRRSSRDLHRQQEAELPRVPAPTQAPPQTQEIDALEEMQRENPDDHTSSK